MLEYLKSKEDFVNAIVKHLGTSAVMDLLLRLITSVESPQLRQDLLEVKLTICNSLAFILTLHLNFELGFWVTHSTYATFSNLIEMILMSFVHL